MGDEKKSFYAKLEKRYLPVSEDGKVEVVPFLNASEASIIPLIDMLGSTAFAFVKSDVNGNIKKLREKFAKNPEKYKTFDMMIDEEIEQKATEAKNSATDALIWLIRGLYFVCVFIKLLSDHPPEKESIGECLNSAYDKALKRFHYMIVQGSVKLAFKAAPYYSKIIEMMSNGVDKDTLKSDINNYQQLLDANIQIIHKMYEERKLKYTPLGPK